MSYDCYNTLKLKGKVSSIIEVIDNITENFEVLWDRKSQLLYLNEKYLDFEAIETIEFDTHIFPPTFFIRNSNLIEARLVYLNDQCDFCGEFEVKNGEVILEQEDKLFDSELGIKLFGNDAISK